jgi:hypothetical protein
MNNKIDVNVINKQKQLENNVNDISDTISTIALSYVTKNIENNIKKTKEEIEEIFKELKITHQSTKKEVLKDINSIDKSSYEYRSKYLKRKLNETEFYSILRKHYKYY